MFFEKTDSKEETEGTDGGGGAFGTLPVESDFMLAYATVPGESKKQLHVLMCLAFYPKGRQNRSIRASVASSCKGSNRSLEKNKTHVYHHLGHLCIHLYHHRLIHY